MTAHAPSDGRTDLRRPLPADALALTGAAAQAQRIALIQESHQRCAALGLSRIERPDYEPLMRSDLAVARERNQRLSSHAAPVMEMLLEQIVDTGSMIVLTDAHGTVLHTVGDDDFLERAGKVALAPGVNWAEHSKGTNAIGTALFAETATLVHAGEHFMYANSFLTCSAAPIFDPRGNMLGVLDVTGDHRSYHQHTMGLVRMSARMIENHWLGDDYTDCLRLHFHSRGEFIGTLLEGIVVAGADGRILGANRSAVDQIGLSMALIRNHSVSSLFGISPAALFDHLRAPLALPLRLHLHDGRVVHANARCSGASGLRTMALAASAEPRASGAATADPARPATDPPARPALRRTAGLDSLRTGDPHIEALIGRLQRVLDRDIALLILGETGTGKELLARAIHHDSQRGRQAFVAVDCAAIEPSLIEAELFGSEDGATSGGRRKPWHGRIVQAHGGTLFLDDIAELPAGAQARLLRVLNERSVTPLRSHHAIPVDVAVIAATRLRPRDLIAGGAFREDLYYRLNGLALRMPALRERSDLTLLAQRILQAECPLRTPRISAAVMEMMQRHAWPGNVRQLANVLRSAALMAAGADEITEADLPDDLFDDLQPAGEAVHQTGATRRPADGGGTLEQVEVALIRQTLDAAGGNVSAAARRLGVSRNTIYRKLR